MQRLGMVIRSLHIYYIVCRVPRFGVRFGTAVYVGGGLCVEGSVSGVVLDKLAAWWHLFAHEHGEHAVGFCRIADGDTLQHTVLWVHGGVPKLLWVHFTKTFESLNTHILFFASAILVDKLTHLHIGPAIFRVIALDSTVEWWGGDIEVTVLHDWTNATEEEGHQQRGDVGTVHIGIGHDNHTVVAELFGVVVAWVGDTERTENGDYRFAFVDFVLKHLFHVQNLTTQWKNGLELTVAALLCRTTCRVTLDEEQLRLGWVLA